MANHSLKTSYIVEFDGEPRVRDVDLGFSLGTKNPATTIRELIARNRSELEMYGPVAERSIEPSDRGGRPGKAFYLNEGQALLVCMFSRTPTAAEIRKSVIEVFMAYRAGKIVHVKPHTRERRPRKPLPVGGYLELTQRTSAAMGRIEGDVPMGIGAKLLHYYSVLCSGGQISVR